MNHQCYNVIGVMSGTSLDAIDIAYLRLVRNEHWSFHFIKTKSVEYISDWKKRLEGAFLLDDIKIKQLNLEYTIHLAEQIKQFIEQEELKNVLAICSHGHTVFHKPEINYTLQIGNLPKIAKLIGVRTICDFRVQDVLLGGQGAPLVPIGDQLLFPQFDYCLNLGGFANISCNVSRTRIAYDISPVNVVLNQYAKLLGVEYDDKGAFAKAGNINNTVLNNLNSLDFYTLKAPKSLGMEWVNQNIWCILDQIEDVHDTLATFTEHVAIQIASCLQPNSKVLVTGGGAYNDYLIERVNFHGKVKLIIPEPEIIEYKEALIFALLGVLKLRNENNCLASVTGALRDHSSGEIYLP